MMIGKTIGQRQRRAAPRFREPRHDQWGNGGCWEAVEDVSFVETNQADFELLALKDIEKSGDEFVVLRYDEEDKKYKKCANGYAIICRAKEIGGLTGLRHAEFLTRNQRAESLVQNKTGIRSFFARIKAKIFRDQHEPHSSSSSRQNAEIPEDWRECNLFFPGTIRRYGDGLLRVLFLFWNGAKWCLGWCRLGDVLCSDNDRIVRLLPCA